MPIQPNFLERTAFFTLNAAPGPMLDLAGGQALQVINTAVQLNLFTALYERPSTPTELAQSLNCQERGLEKLLAALAAIGYVGERDGRYHILLFNLLHHYDLETNHILLQRAYAALKPGGKVAIFDQVAGKQFGSATNAIVQLVGLMYYLFADGRIFTRDELTDLLTNTGFRNIQFHPMRQAPGSSLLVAEK